MKLIINADDFGLSKSITDGIIEGIGGGGYITSTSIMMNMPYAEYAINKAIQHNINCVGIHIVLTFGKPLISNRNLTDENGVFYYNRQQIDRNDIEYIDVYNEVKAQIDKFFELSKGKLKLNHLNTHHFLYNNVMRKAIFDLAREYNLPIRNELGLSYNEKDESKDLVMPDIFIVDWSLVNVTYDKLKSIIDEYKNQNVSAEIMTHSGYVDDYTKGVTSYLDREKELNILKLAKQRGLFDDVQLISFSQLV